jgi:N-acetylglucosamine-6-phosphate deacetylase
LDHEAVTGQLIADGFHVHPAAMRTLVHAKDLERVCPVSDAVSVARMPDDVYDRDNRKLVHAGGTSRFPDGALAGSAMMLNRMLQVSVEQASFSFAEAVHMASEVPAGVLGLRKGRLSTGYDADMVVLQGDYRPSLSIIGGEIIYQE